MPPMSRRTASYLEAVEHLPDDSILVIHDVAWNEYEQLLHDLERWPGMRVSYNKGRLEIVSPSKKHEKIKSFIHDLVAVFCEEKQVRMENLGAATFRREPDAHGVEPDVCFYVTNLDRIIGVDDMDSTPDPPPDVAVEIDISNDSKTKFEIYAGLKVPEIWIYSHGRMQIHQLAGDDYLEIQSSRIFLGITADVLSDFVKQSMVSGRTAALAGFRQWARNNR
jgi:Uma2 family endonuclease